MKILVIGKSAAEQALIKKITESKKVSKIYCIPGNPAIAEYAECVNIALDDITAMVEFAKENEIDLTIPLNEYVIQNGIGNIFRQENLKIFAPTLEAAQIATSRAFSKKFIYKHKIPTTKFGVFDKEATAIDYIKKASLPLLVKYDYWTHQDTFICNSFVKARNTVLKAFEQTNGKVIVEEFLEGELFTLSIISDGYNILPISYTKEYKRVLDGDGGAFSKGIGAYSPFMKITSNIEKKLAQKIVFPLIDALQNNKIAYEGFLTLEILLLKNGDIKLIECLPTLGTVEATCSIPLIENDLFEIIHSASNGALEDCQDNLIISNDTIVSVALMSGNYPNNYKGNSVVDGIENIDEDNIELYYNDTGMNSYYEVVTTGGRAFIMSARASNLTKARQDVYNNIELIQFAGKHYRKDIAKVFIPNNL